MKRQYAIDLNVTDACNMRCTYCFEKDHKETSFEDVDLFLKKMDQLLQSKFFTENYKILQIGFWGGEPSLKIEMLLEIFKHFESNTCVKFFIYGNGFNFNSKLFEMLYIYRKNFIDKNTPKILQQISYDGFPIHNRYRLTTTGGGTALKVKETIRSFQNLKIPYVTKSTLPVTAFKYLEAAYLDFEEVLDLNHTDYFHSTNFFPTIEHYPETLTNCTDKELEGYHGDLRKNLVNIAVHEIRRKIKYFSWFRPSRKLCSAGHDLVCIDTNGCFYDCHGTLYNENKDQDHYITRLEDDNWIYELEQSHKRHSGFNIFEPEECRDCYAPFCLRCNAVKYVNSGKKVYIDRWRDYGNQKQVCKLYRINAKIISAINLIKKREP